jgi:hypothetical protein
MHRANPAKPAFGYPGNNHYSCFCLCRSVRLRTYKVLPLSVLKNSPCVRYRTEACRSSCLDFGVRPGGRFRAWPRQWSITGKLKMETLTRRRACNGYAHLENKNVTVNAVQSILMLNDNGGVEPCGNGVFFPE